MSESRNNQTIAIVQAQPAGQSQYTAIISLVLDAVDSVNTRRAYGRALHDFMSWYALQPEPKSLGKAVVNRYRTYLQAQGFSASTINQRLSAIRKLAVEAADNDILDQQSAGAIKNVKGIRQEGKRAGNWLSQEQAQLLLDQPDCETLKGKRDRAMLAVLLGCGLRRAELISLTWSHIQERGGQPVIVDLVGKRNKIRSVPVPAFVKQAIQQWWQALSSPASTDKIFLALDRYGNLGQSITPQAVYSVLSIYATQLNLTVHPHDLRRTYAKLSLKNGADIKQIQYSLGHGSVTTTEIYIGNSQDLEKAPGDKIGLF